MSEFEKRYQEIVDTMEKAAARKGNEVHDTKKNAKAQDRRENAAATEANRTLEEAEAQEIEKRSMKCSSTAANQWCVPAQSEHRRQDGWTSTPCGCDGIRKDSAYDMMAGERKIKYEEGAQEVERRSMTSSSTNTRRWGTDVKTIGRFHPAFVVEVAAAAAATCWQGSDCRNNARKVMITLKAIQKNILVHKFRIRTKRQVLWCSIPAATRASSRTSTKKRA